MEVFSSERHRFWVHKSFTGWFGGSVSEAVQSYDYIVIGSGFGGSVSALRLAQKGYRVLVVESGKRWSQEDFPKTNMSVRRFFWFPRIFCYGIQRMNLLNDVMVVSGAGVGGGSLVYANTLYVPPDPFFGSPTIKQMGGREALEPYYQLAKKMLGVRTNPTHTNVDDLMYETAEAFGIEDTFRKVPVGIYFGEANRTDADPYFYGEGPERTGCNECGGCMVGCRFGAKNTLDKNYLYFAEKLGAEILPEYKVVDLRPLSADGSSGYEVVARKTTSIGGYPRRRFRTKGVVFSAGVLGTLSLLFKLKESGRLPRISKALGHGLRTNSEAILGAISRKRDTDYSKGIAITSSVYPDEGTHIEPVRYSEGSDVMGFLATLITDGGGRVPRPLRYLAAICRHPLDFLRTIVPWRFAQRSVIVLVMQTLDNSLRAVRRRRWIWPFEKSITSVDEAQAAAPRYIPIGNAFTRKLAENMDGIPASSLPEVLFNIPSTAHILGGSAMAEAPEGGVVDLRNRVFGYERMYVIDGSMIPANLGVNPSLSIAALAEHAMAQIPAVRVPTTLQAEREWAVTDLLHPEAHSDGQHP